MKRLCFILALALSTTAPISGFSIELDDLITKPAGSNKGVVTTVEKSEVDGSSVAVSSVRAVTVSTKFDRIDQKTPCYYLYKKNNFEVNEDITKCRISEAKKRGHLKACESIANGSPDDLNNCLADRGTSQVSIDERKQYIEELRAEEEKNRKNGKSGDTVVEDFKHTKKNSIARTFHFWEIVEQHNVPVLYGRNKTPTIRVVSYSYNSDGSVNYRDNKRGLKIYNTPKQMCKMLRDEKDNVFEDVVFHAGRPLALVDFPDTPPYRQQLRHEDFNDGQIYRQLTDIIGIGEDGEYIEARQGEKNKFYLHYLKITCVRRLANGEEANEDLWKKETRLFHKEFPRIFEERMEAVHAENSVENGAKPQYYFRADGTVGIMNGSSVQSSSDRDVRRNDFTGRTSIDSN